MSKKEQGKPKPKIVALKKSPQTKAKANTDKADAAKAFKDAFGFGEGKMRELAEAFQQALEIKRRATDLQEWLRACRMEARDQNRTVTYVCDGDQRPIAVVLEPGAIAGRSAEEVSERLQAVLREGYRCSKAHMLAKSQELVGDFETSYWEQQQESLRQKEQSGAISFVTEPEEEDDARAKAK
ncbi:MAG: YbaB/EbfC family nucleoid-associated protein [Leptolyngbya sp. SIO1E4]|nr:YbaB/EbfC family nucleoid-associated protein [Leptolyngbya sp. SIO1E4]